MIPPRFRERRSTLLLLVVVLALAAAVRMPFWLSYTYAYGHGDAIIWEVWSRAIYQHGFINVLRTSDSNNIGYHYVLWPTSIVYGHISPDYELWTRPIRILIKIPPFVCDLALATLIFLVARRLSTATTQLRRDVSGALAACAFALAQGAWNGWSILDARGDPHPKDAVMTLAGHDISYVLLSLALCAIATIVALIYLRRHLDTPGLLLSAAAMVFAFYMLPTSTHER